MSRLHAFGIVTVATSSKAFGAKTRTVCEVKLDGETNAREALVTATVGALAQDDEVFVLFEHEDNSLPIVIGKL